MSEKKGVIGFEDMLPGVTTKVEKDASGGKSMVVIEHKEDLNPQIIVKDSSGKAIATYSVPTGAQVSVDEGTRIDAGSIIAKTPRQASKTQDITGGLPRVAELFEARRPKESNVGHQRRQHCPQLVGASLLSWLGKNVLDELELLVLVAKYVGRRAELALTMRATRCTHA